jgi:hypothetical protein
MASLCLTRVTDRRLVELGRVEVVEAGELDRDEGAADLGHVAAAERVDAAGATKQVVALHLVEPVVGQFVLAGEQAEGVGLDQHRPVADLGAEAAVALAGAGGEIDVGLEADRAAVAAAVVGLQGHGLSPSMRSINAIAAAGLRTFSPLMT